MKINGALGLKDGVLKEIGYYKGYSTPFTEEIVKINKEAKKERPPIFTHKKHLDATTLEVRESDSALIAFIECHEDFNKKFERYSEDIESKRKLMEYSEVEKALSIVNESDEYRIKALGLCIIGFDTFGRESIVITKDLKKLAFEEPRKVIDEYENANFDNKLLVSLAFCSNVLETNETHTAIQWVNGKGRVLGIATGEDSIVKMTEFIASQTAESNSVMQEIGKRLDRQIAKKAVAQKDDAKVQSLQERIKELEARLAGKEPISNIEVNPENIPIEEMTLAEARDAYREKFKKPIGARFKNDIEWIKIQLSGAIHEVVED